MIIIIFYLNKYSFRFVLKVIDDLNGTCLYFPNIRSVYCWKIQHDVTKYVKKKREDYYCIRVYYELILQVFHEVEKLSLHIFLRDYI